MEGEIPMKCREFIDASDRVPRWAHCSNNLKDFGLRKGLDNLEAVREKLQAITSRFASFQAQWLNVHVDFPLLQIEF
jgi:hypothetical protein